MQWITEPFEPEFMQRALVAGALVALICSLVGTWVVLRGLAFMGDALAHGVLPGIALALLMGFDVVLGAAAGAALMVLGVALIARRTRLPEDTGIGLLFVGMLAVGVIMVSRSESFASDLTAVLFGDVLGVTPGDVAFLVAASAFTLVVTWAFYRPFLALSFNARKAATLGLHPRLAHAVLLGLVALAVVASFRAVGTLLVFGLLVAPPATASLVTRRLPTMTVVAVLAGWLAVVAGLLLSWHAGLAAGASIAAVAVGQFFVVLAAVDGIEWVRGRRASATA